MNIYSFITTLALAGVTIHTSAQEAWEVTGKAWEALAAKDWGKVETLANRSARTWGDKAKERNDNLSTVPNGEAAKGFASLNELATVTWLKGEALRLKGDHDGAMAAYYTLLADYNYGQCWDKKGWWWQPATAARDRIDQLAPSSQEDIHLDTEPLSEDLRLPGKKGICFTLRDPDKKTNGTWDQNIPRVEATKSYWNYSWSLERVERQPEDLEFMPMLWGAWGMEKFEENLATHVIPQIKAGHAKRLLPFNEPDKPEQANMPVSEVLKYWPKLEELGIPLCSPACANPLSDIDESTQGVRGTWMRDFMKEADARNYRMDYIGVHWYGGTSPRAFKERMIEVYEEYGKRPLLITEFAVADWGAKTPTDNANSPAAVLGFMKEVLPWLEAQNWIAGYSWFSFEIDEAPGTSSSLFDKDGDLTACGRFYQSITTEDPDGDQSISIQ